MSRTGRDDPKADRGGRASSQEKRGGLAVTMPGYEIAPEQGHGDRLDDTGQVARPANRPDIDGLRAVAVVPVLLFHGGVPYFSGGFIGVDIFFVISGFLITAIIDRELRDDRFSLLNFYERRARRILPALYVMMAATALLAWLMFLPKDLEDTGQSLVATATYLSNFLFYLKTNYFGIAAQNKPLLHTWSLAVEEQFYIVFPLILMALWRWKPNRLMPLLGILFAVSFGLSVYGARTYPTETFYLPMTRYWELSLGSILALALQRGSFPKRSSETLSFLGFALIIASITLLDDHTPFPGLAALPACAGTGLIIYAGTGTSNPLVSRILSFPVLVFIGLISYSLYLWHWPALVFAEYYNVQPLNSVALMALFCLIFLISALSWRWVEKPVRTGRILQGRRALFGASALGIAIFAGLGLAMHFSGGFRGRISTAVLQLDAQRQPQDLTDCGPPPGARFGALCKIGRGPPQFVVWGDSHSGALRAAFEVAGQRANSAGLVISANGCAPVLDVRRRQIGREQNHCGEYNRQVLELIDYLKIRSVFLAADWRSYVDRRKYISGNLEQGLSNTLRVLTGRKIVLIKGVPGGRREVASSMARSLWFDRPHGLRLTVDEASRLDLSSDRIFDNLRQHFQFTLVDPKAELCADGLCKVDLDGIPLYSDTSHLTAVSGEILEPLITPLLPRTCAAGNCKMRQ